MMRAVLPVLLLGIVIATIVRGPADHAAFALTALPAVHQQQVCQDDVAGGKELHHAAAVIVFPDGTDTYCVSFTEDEISGAELLQRTGLPLVFSGFGGLGSGVCRIDDVGCSDPGNCFCQCRGADCHYWTYFELDGTSWEYLNVGASQRNIQDGDVDGWVWGNGHTPPGVSSTSAICPALQATPTQIATPAAASDGIGSRPAATPMPPTSAAPRNERGTPGRPSATSPIALIAQPSATKNTTEPATQVLRVLRQSSRPTRQTSEKDAAVEDGGQLPVGIVAFGAVAGGLVAVGGALAVKRRLDG